MIPEVSEESIVINVEEIDVSNFRRLDQYIHSKIPHISRTLVKKIFELGLISSEGDKSQKLELKKMPPAGTKIEVQIPPPVPMDASPENIPLEILYEDEYLVFVNKPAGLVTHPAPGNYTGTLVNALLYHCPDITGGGKRPGIVHRLDKGTSGVMVVAKTRECHEELIELFSSHDIERYYEAVVIAKEFPSRGTIKSLIGRHRENRLKMSSQVKIGREAITNYQKIYTNGIFHHLELKLETGRTHQIRVHLSELMHAAILGDQLYGNVKQQLMRVGDKIQAFLSDYPHPLLHAKTLGLVHPISKKKLSFTVSPPKIFQNVLDVIYNR